MFNFIKSLFKSKPTETTKEEVLEVVSTTKPKKTKVLDNDIVTKVKAMVAEGKSYSAISKELHITAYKAKQFAKV
jgi:hypothetical protein